MDFFGEADSVVIKVRAAPAAPAFKTPSMSVYYS